MASGYAGVYNRMPSDRHPLGELPRRPRPDGRTCSFRPSPRPPPRRPSSRGHRPDRLSTPPPPHQSLTNSDWPGRRTNHRTARSGPWCSGCRRRLRTFRRTCQTGFAPPGTSPSSRGPADSVSAATTAIIAVVPALRGRGGVHRWGSPAGPGPRAPAADRARPSPGTSIARSRGAVTPAPPRRAAWTSGTPQPRDTGPLGRAASQTPSSRGPAAPGGRTCRAVEGVKIATTQYR